MHFNEMIVLWKNSKAEVMICKSILQFALSRLLALWGYYVAQWWATARCRHLLRYPKSIFYYGNSCSTSKMAYIFRIFRIVLISKASGKWGVFYRHSKKPSILACYCLAESESWMLFMPDMDSSLIWIESQLQTQQIKDRWKTISSGPCLSV